MNEKIGDECKTYFLIYNLSKKTEKKALYHSTCRLDNMNRPTKM